MKLLITGAAGQLGSDLVTEVSRRGHEAVGVDIADMDITDPDSVHRVMDAVRPDAVIHCAAWTAVDAAEEPANLEKVRLVNADGTAHIAESCRDLGCKMMYLSTDYVFDGRGDTPWDPDCKTFAPLNVYGRTKLEGELAVSGLLSNYFIVRIAWVFGRHGANFVKTMLNIGKKRNRLTVVNDQIGTPTYTPDLARLLADMIETDQYGFYHATNEGGYISWYEFAKEIFSKAAALGFAEYEESRLTVLPVTTAEYGLSLAARPFNSRLDKSKLAACGFQPLPDWRDALARYLKELADADEI